MREKESFRDNMERLNAVVPDKELLSVKEVMAVTGLTRYAADKLTAGHRIVGCNKISKASLARLLST